MTQNPSDIQLEPSFAPFLFTEGNLGIPYKTLLRTYLHAVGIFKSVRSCIPTRPTSMAQQNPHLDPSLVRSLAASSSVVVVGNPCHQTALNARKHLVRMDLLDLHTELRFTAALLSAERCVKQGELWYHRQWLLRSACTTQLSNATDAGSHCRLQLASREALQQELELVSHACEVYPRNYFAWTHRLTCIQSLLSDYSNGTDAVGFVSIFRNEIKGLKRWIDRHVSDYSAIHTILALSQVACQSRDAPLVEIVVEEDLLDHATCLVQEYPIHESLWMYVRTAISIPCLQQAQKIQQFRDDFVRPLVHLHLETGIKEGFVHPSQYARWFLERQGTL